jgi:hypothetical protein
VQLLHVSIRLDRRPEAAAPLAALTSNRTLRRHGHRRRDTGRESGLGRPETRPVRWRLGWPSRCPPSPASG